MQRQELLHQSRELGQQRELLANARAMFGELMMIAAHDLGVPLRSIAAFSQLLDERFRPLLDEQAQRYIDIIREHSRTAQARLASLLQYCRLDTVPLNRQTMEMQAAVSHALAQLGEKIAVREAIIRVSPLPQLVADYDRLSLLFYALIDNALTFCTGRPDIAIAARRNYDAWIITVRDNGIGIAPRHHLAIFDLFFRLHGEKEYPGTGTGLAIASRITSLHGGLLWVESREGGGATFFLSLPDAKAGTA